jgi:hypothetical protein
MSDATTTTCQGTYEAISPAADDVVVIATDSAVAASAAGTDAATFCPEGTVDVSGKVDADHQNFKWFAAAIWSRDPTDTTSPPPPEWATVVKADTPTLLNTDFLYPVSFSNVKKPKGKAGEVGYQWNYLYVWGNCKCVNEPKAPFNPEDWTYLGGVRFAGRL